MSTSDDDTLHGSGRKIGPSQIIQIEIEKEAETAGAMNAYVYYIKDARLDIDGGRLQNITK